MKNNLMFAQSGGPTSVINASAQGVFDAGLASKIIGKVYAGIHGIKGIINNNIIDISQEDPRQIQLLKTTPSSALGSVRYKLKDFTVDETDYIKIFENFDKLAIKYFLYNGGNDSMDTITKISKYARKIGYDLISIGVPKTIDNDLAVTDHCPGYGSAAKYIITSCMELSLDASVYDKGKVVIVEAMGRNAGWLPAASKVATYYGHGPDLIYLPERKFDINKFLADIDNLYTKNKYAFAVVSEGLKDSDGKLLGTMGSAVDSFNHAQLGGVAPMLANCVNNQLKHPVRPIEFSLLQRCASHIASKFDVDEAYNIGKEAVKLALNGINEKMVISVRNSDNTFSLSYTELTNIANVEKIVDNKYINDMGNNINDNFIDYCLPLINGESHPPFVNGIPQFTKLNKKNIYK